MSAFLATHVATASVMGRYIHRQIARSIARPGKASGSRQGRGRSGV
jgi:hypothetical protein